MWALSVADQDAAIRELFPAFRLTCPFDFLGKWRGPLRPLSRIYEIGIAYFPRVHFAGAVITNPWITVEVLDPVIGLDPRGTGDVPPHIYRRPDAASGWSLCLFDPSAKDWGPHQPIAETIIPWAAEWLFFYEGWLIDGLGTAAVSTPRQQGDTNVLPSASAAPLRRQHPGPPHSSELVA